MEIKIYIDVLLVINFIFNYLLLWVTGLLLKQRVKTGRLFLSALIGAMYAVCVFFLPAAPIYGIAGKLVTGALMAGAAFAPKCLKAFIKYICVFYASVFILGGAAFAFFYFSNGAATLGAIYRNGTLYINFPVYLLLVLCLFCWLLLRGAFALGARISAAGRQIFRLRLLYKGKAATLRALYDSGNLLRDEISGKSVIVAEWNSVKALFDMAASPREAAEAGAAFISIAYRTIQGKDLLYAFLPDEIYIESGRRRDRTEPLYIGLVNRTLDYYNNWDAILPYDFKGVEKYETKTNPPVTHAY